MTLNRNDIWKFGTLTVSPFDWLEAGYFYYRPSDLRWEVDLKRGNYLDKGFNVKFIYRPENKYLPNIAVGLDDFAGTGYFSREYVVSTYESSNLKISFGAGWGKFVGTNSYKNPFSQLSEKFNVRPKKSNYINSGGTPTYDQWFRGDVNIFGGLEYSPSFSKNLKIKLEYDPFNYKDFSANNREDIVLSLRDKDSNYNLGLSYAVNKFLTIESSLIKGNTFNLSFNFGITFKDDLVKKSKFNPKVEKTRESNSKKNFYDDLLYNLNNNNLLLQTASIEGNGKLDITISTSNHRNSIRSSSYAAKISDIVADFHNVDLSQINVKHINAGIELNEISYVANHITNKTTPIEFIKRYTKFDSGNVNEYLSNEFKPRVSFPVFFHSTSPSIVSHIGNPEKFYFGGINIQNISELQFSRNLILSSELNFRLYDNFRDTITGPASQMEHVRTELVQYLKEDDIYISRLQLDYIWSPKKNLYAKISGGYFETMFGGFGGQILYRPFNNNFSISSELFYVKQRTFDQRFNFQKYNTTTGHLNFAYMFAKGVEANLSFGRYLAKDDGYTFDISRRTNSGFKAGVYFTRTNVSAEVFGEGSFDKGFYFQIPLDFFSDQYLGTYSTVKISPLTRDGGAKLIYEKDLRGLIYNSTKYEFSKQWDGYLD